MGPTWWLIAISRRPDWLVKPSCPYSHPIYFKTYRYYNTIYTYMYYILYTIKQTSRLDYWLVGDQLVTLWELISALFHICTYIQQQYSTLGWSTSKKAEEQHQSKERLRHCEVRDVGGGEGHIHHRQSHYEEGGGFITGTVCGEE